MSESSHRRVSVVLILQLLIVVAAGLTVPAWVARKAVVVPESEEVPPNDPMSLEGERRFFSKSRPDWILIGNSMVNSRYDRNSLPQVTGRRVRKIALGGTQSAIWFLMLKNVVLQSEARPQWITLFFRDYDLTWPEFRTEGPNADLIKSLREPSEPEWDVVFGREDDSAKDPVDRVSDLAAWAYPAKEARRLSRQFIQNKAFDLTSWDDIGHGIRREEMNEAFSLSHLRADLGGDVNASTGGTGLGGRKATAAGGEADVEASELPDPGMYDGAPHQFTADPKASFLPHMVALAKKHGFKLHFHRVKRRPLPNNLRPDSRLLRNYMAELRAYLDKEGVLFTDESQDPTITLDMYQDGDHIGDFAKAEWTKNFWSRVGKFIGPPPTEDGENPSPSPSPSPSETVPPPPPDGPVQR